jgi:hypothetical protein
MTRRERTPRTFLLLPLFLIGYPADSVAQVQLALPPDSAALRAVANLRLAAAASTGGGSRFAGRSRVGGVGRKNLAFPPPR